MNRLRGDGTNTERALEQVCARTQMLNRAQIFQRVALLLKRIVHRTLANDHGGVSLQLEGLLHAGRKHQRAGKLNSRADGNLLDDFAVIIQLFLLKNHLQVAEIAAIIQLDECESLGFAGSAHPAVDLDVSQISCGHVGVEFLNEIMRHNRCPPFR